MTLVKCSEISPAATACSAHWPMRHRWCERPEPHHAHAVLLRARDADLHRLQPDHLAVALLAVERNHRAAVEHDLRVLVDDQPAFEQRLDVARDHAHAVRIVPGQVRGDQVLGDDLRLARVAAAGSDDRFDGF